MSTTVTRHEARLIADVSSDRPRRGTDAAAAALFLIGALVITSGLWVDPSGRAIATNAPDQAFFEWVLSYTAHAVTHGTNPWFTHVMNAPLGVNLAANTTVTVIGIVLMPVTLLFGAPVALVTGLTLGLALTAYTWYWLFSRHVVTSGHLGSARVLAVAGGGFCGFAPGIIAHASGHLNFTVECLIPLLLWRLVRLTRFATARSGWRDGTIIGVLAALQYSIAAELLLFTAFAVGIYAVAWSVQRAAAARRIAATIWRPIAVATFVGAALIAYPVWMQMWGPQVYHGTGFAHIGASENLASFGALSSRSVGGVLGAWTPLTVNPVEESSYFGPVLLLIVIACGIRLCRPHRVDKPIRAERLIGPVEARALCWTGVIVALFSLGSPLRVGPWTTSVPMPWALVTHLPLFGAALPGRLALLLTPIVALLLIATLDEVVRVRRSLPMPLSRTTVMSVSICGTLAIVPILPLPIPTAPRAPVPVFITSGDWRRYLPAGTTLLTVPPATSMATGGQRWQVASGFGFPIEGGYFLGPGAAGRSRLGPVARRTDLLLNEVAKTGPQREITTSDRTAAQADLAYWHTGLIVLPDTFAEPDLGIGEPWAPNAGALMTTCTELFGPPQHVDDVWLWRPDVTF